jgi:hypothetical protein
MGTNRPSAEELDKLENRAARQRQEVGQTYSQVREDFRKETSLGRQIQRRPAAAYGVAGFFGLIMGYKLGRALK